MEVYSLDREFGLLLIVILLVPLCILDAAEPVVVIHVSPKGNDTCSGTKEKPLATLAAVQQMVRASTGRQPVTVILHEGVYYLPDTLVFTEVDSGTEKYPIVYTAAPGEHSVISGGMKLTLEWKPETAGIMEAAVPNGLSIDQLWINGKRQSMARFPNRIPGKNVFDHWDLNNSNEPVRPSEDALLFFVIIAGGAITVGTWTWTTDRRIIKFTTTSCSMGV